jgi:hypothetical protein
MLVRARGVEAVPEDAYAPAGNCVRGLDASNPRLFGGHVVGSGFGVGLILP